MLVSQTVCLCLYETKRHKVMYREQGRERRLENTDNTHPIAVTTQRERQRTGTHTHTYNTPSCTVKTQRNTQRDTESIPHRDTSKHKKHKVYCGCGCPLSLCLSLSRDSEGVVLSVFSNRLSPLISIHTSVSLCFTETQTDRLRDQQRRVWGEYED